MNSTRPTPLAPAQTGLVHESSRTTLSTNRDPETGKAERFMANTRLQMAWVHGELQVRFLVSHVKLGSDRLSPVRRARGTL